MRFTTLDEWLRWQEGTHPNAIDLGLDRVRQVADTLGFLSPETHPSAPKVITVAGTNGKGSCIAAMESLLASAGKSYGAYTSPHIQKYNERVRVCGVEAADQEFCEAFSAIDKARGETSLTYFEFGTLAALYILSRKPLDFWLLEVGLGGRLDAINIIDADLAIITSIDIDHIDWLGDNRESIGFEKAGICRNNVPLICSDASPPQSVLDKAQQLNCPLYLLGDQFMYHQTQSSTVFKIGYQQLECQSLALPVASVAAALQAVVLLGVELNQSGFVDTLNSMSLPGRMQEVRVRDKIVVLDVAHNPAAMRHLALQLTCRYPNVQFCAVLAMMADKNMVESLSALKPVVKQWCLTTIEELSRAASANDLLQALTVSNADCFDSVEAALSSSLNDSNELFILVTGSFYTVSAAQKYLSNL